MNDFFFEIQCLSTLTLHRVAIDTTFENFVPAGSETDSVPFARPTPAGPGRVEGSEFRG